MAPFDGKYMTSYLMATVTFALSHTIYEIFTKQMKCQKFYLENEGRGGEKRDLRHSTGNVRFCIDKDPKTCDIFLNNRPAVL